MNCLPAQPQKLDTCAICGIQKRQSTTWFALTQLGQEDRLNIWSCQTQMPPGMVPSFLCSPRHVRELVRHWMENGCLSYPFAGPPPDSQEQINNPDHTKTSGMAKHLGQIAVDRESLARAFRDNPLSLNTILDELMILLESEVSRDDESEFESEYCSLSSGM